MALALTGRERQWLALSVLAAVAVRLVTLGAYPLMDTTEARYAEIARKMLETGDWLVPQFAYGVPFWGKPPLSMWLTAASMAVFGANEFGARLPSFLLFVGSAVFVHWLARLRGGSDRALWTVAAYGALAIVYVSAGAVMTDPALAFGTTMAMVGFWIAARGPASLRGVSGLGFFAGLAVGLLAKGPVAAVLIFVPLGAWTLWRREWGLVWRALPWFRGALLTALMVVPWYWAAERASPGFLESFLVGEHWKRFVEAGWTGDLYGAAHARPRGMIWLFWIAAALPWTLLLPAWFARSAARRRTDVQRFRRGGWLAYLLLWAVTPMLFFSVSGNVLLTYVLPGMPAFALLVCEFWRPAGVDRRGLRAAVRWMIAGVLALPVMVMFAIAAFDYRAENQYSHKALLKMFTLLQVEPAQRLVYLGQQPVSAEFYSRGKAIKVRNAAALEPYLADPIPDFIVARDVDFDKLTAQRRAQLAHQGTFGEYRLYREVLR